MKADPRDTKLDDWLRSLDPRDELVHRLAMHGRFAEARQDRPFGARINELSARLELTGDELMQVLDDARLAGAEIEEKFRTET